MDNYTKPYAVRSSRWVANKHLNLFKDLAILHGGVIQGDALLQDLDRQYLVCDFQFVSQFSDFDEAFETAINLKEEKLSWLHRIRKIFSFQRT